ncbi:MAG: T9SS type A sorting domain-containing protein [Fimbriimonadaceae bacterium]|nr:T9SS type A sorting domain-containing protein [Chitinophagales bacterium]
MKHSLCILALLLGAVLTQAGIWENYSNITQITDAKPLGDHIWITGKGGVVDYNTLSGEKIFYVKGEAGLPSSSIEQIAIRSDNSIWIGTYESGLAVLQDGEWESYPFPSAMLLYRMKFDGLGNLWVQADAGLFKFNCDTHDYTFINSVGGAGWDFEAWDFDITPDNEVLIFTGENCLVIDAVTNTPTDSFPNSESPAVVSCTPTTVRVYGVDENSYLISSGFSFEFQFKDGSYEDASEGLPEFASFGNIQRGTDNNLYVLVNGVDIYKLVDYVWEYVISSGPEYAYKLLHTDGENYFVNNYAYMTPPALTIESSTGTESLTINEFNFTSNNIDGITKNTDGEIIIASDAVLYTYNVAENNWNYFIDVPTIYGIASDLQIANGNIYAIDYGNLITYYDGTTWQHIPYAYGYSSIYIYDYHVTETGIVYFLNEEGLFKYEDGVTENLLEGDGVFDPYLSVAYDAERNLIWLGKINKIIKYDFTSQEVINSSDFPAFAEGPAIQEIVLDENNNVWFGANNGKAYMYDGIGWIDFTVTNEDYDFVTEFAFDGTKTYFGLIGVMGGVYVYDSADESWTFYHPSEDIAFASNTVNQIVLDNENDLWIAHTDAGISVLRTESTPDAIEDVQVSNEILVYPNPADNLIYVAMQITNNMQAQIFDMQGKLMQTNDLISPIVELENLQGGVYTIQITDITTGQQYQQKFIVE